MRLVEYNDYLKELVHNDPTDPKIYINLEKMLEVFLKRKKVCNCSKDYENMAYEIAGDVFYDISRGMVINNYLKYLERIYRKYAHLYYKDHREGYIEITDISEYEAAGELFGEPSQYIYSYLDNKIYLEGIDSIIDSVLNKSCKYDPSTVAYTNLKLSLVLSLLRGHLTPYHLTSDQELYLKMLYVNFRNTVVRDGFSGIIGGEY